MKKLSQTLAGTTLLRREKNFKTLNLMLLNRIRVKLLNIIKKLI